MLYKFASLPPIDPEMIGMAFNIGFFVIIGMIVIGFLVGLIRGVWKAGFRLVFVGGLVLVAFFASRPLTDLLASLDIGATLAGFGINIPPIEIALGESNVIINVTTIRATIESFVTQMVQGSGLPAGSGVQTSELVIALTLVLLRYVVFIILGMLIITVGELLASILYFFPFRLFIPKNWRKKHKMRLVGGLLNAVKVTLVTVMLMVPFSSLLNTINQAFRDPDNATAGIDDPTYNQIMGFLDAYNDSLFAQVLFNWSVDADGRTLDTVLMDYVTGETMDDFVLTLSGELYTIASISSTILSTGVLTNGLNETTYPVLLSENIIGSLITSLTGSALIMKALPIAIGVAMNLEQVQEFVDPDLIDLDGISWEQELLNVNQIAQDVVASGVLDTILDPDTEFDPIQLLLAMVSDEAFPNIRAALYGIDNSDFLAQVLPAVVYKLVNDELNAPEPPEGLGLSTFFPTQWEDYQDLRFGEEIALIYDVMHSIANLDPELLPTIIEIVVPSDDGFFSGFDAATTSGTRVKTKGNVPTTPQYADNPQDALVDIVRAHSDELIEIIVGVLDGSGNPTGINPDTGKTVLFDEDEEPIPGAKAALFDSGLLIHGLDELLNFALEPLLGALTSGGEFNRDNLDATIDFLNGEDFGEKRINYKGEFGAILGIVSAIFQNDALLNLIFPEEEPAADGAKLPGKKSADEPEGDSLLTLFEDVAFRDAFKNDICPLLDRSRIMGSVLPDVLESALTNPSMADTFTNLGLDPNSFNFEFTDVGTQMAFLIDIIGFSLSVVDSLDSILGDGDISPVVDDLIGLLDALYQSSIINPKNNTGLMTTDNYYDLLTSLFNRAGTLAIDSDELDTAMRSVPHDGWVTEYDELGDPVFAGENYNLIKFLETALTSDLFNIDSSGDVLDQMIAFATDPDDPIGKVFTAVDSSIIISATMGGIVDGLIGDAGGLIDTSLGSTFRNVTDWELEGETLKSILVALEPFTTGIENIDFMNDDPVKVENILKAIAQSQIFLTPDDEYLFGEFLLNKIKGDGSIMADYVFDPYEDETSPSPYDIVTADFQAIGSTRATAANWYGDDGEIERIIAFVQAIQDFADGDPDPINKLQNDPTITSADVKPIMLALNQIGSMRIMLYNMFDMILGTPQLAVGSLQMSQSNSYLILTIDDEDEREIEIDYMFEVYRTLEELALNDGGDFSMDTITPEKIHEIENMLNALHDSRIFNTFDTSFEARSHALGFLTVFEQVIEMIFDTSMMDSYIYAELPTPEAIDDQLRLDIMAIDNNFADSSVLLDGWIGPSGEIKAITSILTSFKDTGLMFDDFGNDGANAFSNLMATPAGPAKVETLMLDINGSQLAYPAIPNLFDEIFQSGSFAISNVNLDETNTDYFRNESDESERASEITVLIDIYVGIEELDLTGGSPLQLSNIDGDAISTLLTDLHTSKVFNTFKDGYSHPDGDLTVFEQTIKMLYTVTNFTEHIYSDALEVDRPGLLRDDIVAVGNDFAGTVPANTDRWTGLNGEIMTIRNILVALKDTDIDFDAMGNPGSLSTEFNNLLTDPVGQAKLQMLMARINESQIAWPANPNLLDRIFATSGFSITGVDLGDSNPAYLKSMSDVNERQQEIDKVFDIYELLDSLGVNSGDPFDETMLDTMIIDDLLRALHNAVVFNTLQTGKDRFLLDITVFEQMIYMLIDQSQLDEYIYEGIGRDPALKEDIVAIGNDFAGTAPLATDGWRDPDLVTFGEITRIVGILEAFEDTGLTFASFSGAGSSDVLSALIDSDVALVENLLLAMNHSTIVYPSIPNIFANMLTAGDVTISGVNFADANTHYRGNRGNPALDNKYLPYDDGEITQLLTIYSDAKIIAGTSYGDLTLIANQDIDNIRDLAQQLFESHIFHIEGVPDTSSSLATVFEQLIIKMMDDTGISSLINDTANPNPLYYDGMVYKFATAHEKAEYLVVNYEAIYGASAEHHTNVWDGSSGEINALFRIFKEIKRVLPATSGAGGLDPSALAPDDISAILAVLNYSNLASDAIPDLVRDAFETISFDTYTEGNEDYYITPVDYFTIDLTTMDYSATDFTNVTPPVPGPSGLIHNLLDEFYDDGTDSYEDMGGAFNIGDFITAGHTSEPLLHLLDASLVFTNDVPSESYKTRALTFFNILDSADVARYIDFNNPTTDKTSKTEKIETIFATDFDYEFEAERLDLYIANLIGFNTLTDATSIEGLGSEFRLLIEHTYELDLSGAIIDRAYLVSEMSAGFYTDIFEEEYAKVVPEPDEIDFYASDYANLNPLEADGVDGALSILDEIDLILANTFDETDVARLRGHFVKMGSLDNTDVTGGPFPAAYDYSSWDSAGNSLIAKLFYAAEIVQNANFVTFSAGLTAYAWTNKATIVNLDFDPYANDFVFEVEGDKIYFVYA